LTVRVYFHEPGYFLQPQAECGIDKFRSVQLLGFPHTGKKITAASVTGIRDLASQGYFVKSGSAAASFPDQTVGKFPCFYPVRTVGNQNK
jgi:hypothetical protein